MKTPELVTKLHKPFVILTGNGQTEEVAIAAYTKDDGQPELITLSADELAAIVAAVAGSEDQTLFNAIEAAMWQVWEHEALGETPAAVPAAA